MTTRGGSHGCLQADGFPPDLLVRVQHHPGRAALLDRLLPGLEGLRWEVVSDPEPGGRASAWRTYRECLSRPHDAATLLIVQDDAIPAEGAADAVRERVAEHPDKLVAFFLAGAPVRTARLARRAWQAGATHVVAPPREWVPTVALAWPRADAEAFLRWTDERGTPGWHRGDDNLVGAYARERGRSVVVALPSAFQHPDDEPSLIGRRHGNGRNPLRVAAVWTGQAR